MSLEMKHKRAQLYTKGLSEAVMKAVNENYSGKLIIEINFFEGGISECRKGYNELITIDKLKQNHVN